MKRVGIGWWKLFFAVAWTLALAGAAFAQPVVQIRTLDPAATEYAGPEEKPVDVAVFEISRDGGDLAQDLRVFYSIHGTAMNGGDYVELPESVLIPAGSPSALLVVHPIVDLLAVVEPMETVGIRLEYSPVMSIIPSYLLDDKAREAAAVIYEQWAPEEGQLAMAIPRSGFRYEEGETVVLIAALHHSSRVEELSFYSGDRLLGTVPRRADADDRLAFFRFEWKDAAAGSHTVTARVITSSGVALKSSEVRVLVGHDGPPVVAIRYVPHETDEVWPDEDFAPGSLEVSRTGSTAEPLQVFYNAMGTATPNEDYERLPGWILIPEGQRAARIWVKAIDDLIDEPDETVIVNLMPIPPTVDPVVGAYYDIDPDRRSAEVVILDNDGDRPPVVSIAAVQPFTSEPDSDTPGAALIAPGIFRVIRTGETTEPLMVHLRYEGTASPDADYQKLPESVTIEAGASEADVMVFPFEDTSVEGDETVVAALQPVDAAYAIDPRFERATVTIRDNDGGEHARITITSPESGEFFRAGSTIPIEATAVDPLGYISRLEFFANDTKIGESEIVFIVAPPPGEPIYHTFEWKDAPAGSYRLTARGVSSSGKLAVSEPVWISIWGGAPLPIVSIKADPSDISEPTPTALVFPGKFIISRTGSLDLPLRVYLRYAGTATPGLDYEKLPEIIEIPANSNSVELLVLAKVDSILEDVETVIAHLPAPIMSLDPSPSNRPYQISREHRTAVVRIHDISEPDETIVRIETVDASATEFPPFAEAFDPARFRISRTGSLANNVRVFFSIHGTAQNAGDYEYLDGTVNIPAGQASAEVTIIPRSPEVEPATGVPLVVEKMEIVGLRLEESPLLGPMRTYSIDRAHRMAGAVIFERRPPEEGAVEVAIPGGGGRFSADDVEFLAMAFHPITDLNEVDFYVNGVKVGASVIPQDDTRVGGVKEHRFAWADATAGDHLLQAKVSLAGALIESSEIRFVVEGGGGGAPVVRIVSPPDGAVFPEGRPIEVTVVASDRDGTIASVELLADGTRLATSSSSPLTFRWTGAPVGEHILTAHAVDNSGIVGSAAPVRILVRHVDTVAFVNRRLPAAYTPGVPFVVELSANPPASVNAYAVEDRPPAGWAVSAVSHGGVFDAATGKVKFGPFTDSESRMLTYRVTPPASATGRYEFSGESSANGAAYPIGGDQAIADANPYHPADTDQNFAIVLTELTAYAAAWKAGDSWPSGPVPIPVSYVTRAGVIWKRGERYEFDPTAGPAPACWVPLSDPDIRPLAIGAMTADRIFSADAEAGAGIEVRIEVNPGADASSYAVEERPPRGWAVSNISGGGIFDARTGHVRWGIFTDNAARTFSYTVTPPANVSSVGSLGGVLSVDGNSIELGPSSRSVSSFGPAAIQLREGQIDASGAFRVNVTGSPGQTGVLEASSNFRDWTAVQSVFLPDGTLQIQDEASAGGEMRFYRLRVE